MPYIMPVYSCCNYIIQILFETSAPHDRNVVLVRIPVELYWKFAFDQDTPRYWLKLTDDDMVC